MLNPSSSSKSSSSSSSSNWFSSYCTKLRFFIRIRRFLQLKTASSKRNQSPEHFETTNPIVVEAKMIEATEKEEEEEEDSIGLQRSVKQLHFGNWEEKEAAAREIARLASKDLKTRKSLAALGVVPALVSMLDSEGLNRRRLAVLALIELADGTFTNRALMVEAGIIWKLPQNIDGLDPSIKHDYVTLLLSISCLAKTQLYVPLPEMIPFLIGILNSEAHMEVTTASLGAIYNLSSVLENAGPLVSNGAVHTLLRLSLEKEASEKALATLGNLVASAMGKKAMEEQSMVPENLIEIMTWEAEPKCQELAAYILMILAHQSSAQREKMAKLGIVQVLLEVVLLGSALAQKRALKLLQWFKDERQTKIGSHSGPQTGRVRTGSPINKREIGEGREIIKRLVKQSLDKNMELITRRANVGGECSRDSKFKSLVVSSSSKSLPY